MYYVYTVRCSDNSLYTGIASDVARRVSEHYYQKKQAARYTKSHKVTDLSAVWIAEDKSAALKCEGCIKKLSKEEKERLISEKCDFEGCTRTYEFTLEKCIGG